jgi:23S rRNA pseudouridine1911/1915/1917 synthase
MEVVAGESGVRLDKFLSTEMEGISRSYAAKLAGEGRVSLEDGTVLDKKYQVQAGNVIVVDMPEPQQLEVQAEDIPIAVVYEDADVIVVNKPQGMVVHPAPGNYTGTLVNALLYHCKGQLSAINGVIRPGIVHRIDKDTSGLLVVAKNNDAHVRLAAQLKERKAVRRYWAIVNGNIKEDEGTINKPIARSPKDRKKMAIVQGGREAVTHFRVLDRFGAYTLLECVLETGRTHQIRVHMASVGHSIVGDPVYGSRKERFKLSGQLLHAKTIGFVHPATGEYMEFDSPLPEYFEAVLHRLRQDL